MVIRRVVCSVDTGDQFGATCVFKVFGQLPVSEADDAVEGLSTFVAGEDGGRVTDAGVDGK